MRTYLSNGNIFPAAENSLLIDLIQNNQEEAYKSFEKLIDFYSRKLEYEDAVGELSLFFFELINGIDLNKFNTDNTDGLSRYIKTSLKHKYIALSKQRQAEEFLLCELNENTTGITVNFETKQKLKYLLSLLTQKQRTILYYRYFYLLSCAEIAKLLGISRQAVNRLENRAIKFLREIMTK